MSRKSLNERFTDFADLVSEGMGKWWVTAISVVAILAWLSVGPFFHYSDTWQLIVNTPTTILELWIGFLLAAAANRVERRNISLQEQMLQIIQHIHGIAKEEKKTVKGAEETLSFQDQQLLSIVKHLEQIDQLILQLQEKKDG